MFTSEIQTIEAQIRAHCAKTNIPLPEKMDWRPLPFSGESGIFTSFFQAAAQEARQGQKINVPQRAQEIAASVAKALGTLEGIHRVEAVKGYLNLYFDPSAFARRVVDTVLQQGEDFGRGKPKNERVMVEYAQPNTHHSFHIGHYRNAILGEALARLVEFAGYDTIRASYPGDIGLGVITVLWMYDKFYKGQEPEGVHERGQWLLKLYVEATNLLTPREDETPEEKAQREAYDAERREMYRRWDAGDEYVRALWLETREWSLQELRAILEMMDIHIDVWFYESQVDEPGKQIVEELIARGIAEDERPDGPVIVRIDEKLGLKKEKYRTAVILRSDGTTLYLTKDLALAKIKFEQYGVDRSIYVVDTRQSLHFQQAFKILELWGFPQAEKCFHLGYGFVSLPEGAMSARRGRVVLFKEVADEAVRRVLNEIAEKNPSMPTEQREAVALQVGLGALAYAMLSVDNNKDIVFDMDAALSFDGHTGPYIQNAHVRAGSILRKAGDLPSQADFSYQLSPYEVELVDLIARFPETVQQAAEEYRPLVMATYAFDLATAFHRFYHEVPVLQADTGTQRSARLRLVAAAKQTLANALRLLAIQAPEQM
ncbi:MAG: arginine--tRNA ligase [Anaerolineae bacterium]|nr:MAG: arginine--tRNA ligase [Anaerolineae bacterium]